MTKNPIVLVHGYSDEGKSFKSWRDVLVAKGYRVEDVNICSYESLTNEVTIKDLAEGFDRALRIQAGLKDAEKFDAIVHSTGMLVIRSWLTTYNQRRERLNRLIGLAPASFGSPLAGMGRSFLGSFFKGRRELGPDFLEAGDKILDGLELGSRFTWELAHLDLLPIPERPNDTFYGKNESTPYVFIFCGMEPYTGLRQIVNKPGTDGTVRWAGCSLRTRKITVDLTRDLARSGSEKRFSVLRGTNIDIPLVPVSGLNHGTILSQPTEELKRMVLRALGVSNEHDFNKWHEDFKELREVGYRKLSEKSGNWTQFVVHAVDERKDPINDYHLQIFMVDEQGKEKELEDFDEGWAYRADKSFRCYHVNLNNLTGGGDLTSILPRLRARVIASSGSKLVGYHGHGSEKTNTDITEVNLEGKWDAKLDLSQIPSDEARHLFRPFMTTLVELKLNREPMPLPVNMKNLVCWFEKLI